MNENTPHTFFKKEIIKIIVQFLKANILILPLNVLRLEQCYDFKDTCVKLLN